MHGHKHGMNTRLCGSCISSVQTKGLAVGGLIGTGDHSAVYDVAWTGVAQRCVLKCVSVGSTEELASFQAEVAVATEMGEHRIGPVVHRHWVQGCHRCVRTGYCLMDKLACVYAEAVSDSDERAVVRRIEQAVVGQAERLIRAGYMHNDLHTRNIGFDVNGRVVLFDFGCTQAVGTNSNEALACQVP